MQRFFRWLGYALTLAMLVGGGWLLYIGAGLFVAANDTVKLGIITAIISVSALLYNNSRQQAREIKSRQFSDKKQSYQKFFDLMIDVLSAERTGRIIPQAEMLERTQSFVKDLMIWGSPETINQYNSYVRDSLNLAQSGDPGVFTSMEALMRSLRRDLGHDDRKLEILGITKLLIKAEEHKNLPLH